jgi:hypothetical protein
LTDDSFLSVHGDGRTHWHLMPWRLHWPSVTRTRQTLEKDLRTEDSFRNKRILKMENELKAYANVNQEVIVCVLTENIFITQTETH